VLSILLLLVVVAAGMVDLLAMVEMAVAVEEDMLKEHLYQFQYLPDPIQSQLVQEE